MLKLLDTIFFSLYAFSEEVHPELMYYSVTNLFVKNLL